MYKDNFIDIDLDKNFYFAIGVIHLHTRGSHF